MAKWNYTLKNGIPLRQAIHNEEPEKIYTSLIDCFEEVNKKYPEEFDEDELQDVLDDIENARDNFENYEDYDMSYDDVVDEIDWLLEKLYDLCDYLRIWVDL